MSLCDAVSDRMPLVASGRSEWTAEELAHLASCGECAGEWTLVRAASQMGREMTVDAAAITPMVLERVRVAKAAEQRHRLVTRTAVAGTLAVAAVLLLVMVPRLAGPVPQAPNVGMNQGELQLAELDDAAPAELEMVLVEFDGPVVPASSLVGPDVEGLDVSQVERALRSWEES